MKIVTRSTTSPRYIYNVDVGYNSTRAYHYRHQFASRAQAVSFFEDLDLNDTFKARLTSPSGRLIAREGDSIVNPIAVGDTNVRGRSRAA